MLDLLPEVFHHLPQILRDKSMGVHSAVEHHRGKGWMRFQRRHGNGVPPLSMACCTVDVTEASQTTCTCWCFCLPARSERSHVQLSGPTTPGAVLVILVLLICTVEEKKLLTMVTGRALRRCSVKHWVNVNDSQVTKSKEHLTFLPLFALGDGRGGGWLQSRDELFLLILSVLMILPDELRTKDSNIHICPKYSNRPLCNVFVATEQWPSDTLPPDSLPFDQYRQHRQTADTLPLTGIRSIDRLPTPCPLLDISSVGRILPTLFT